MQSPSKCKSSVPYKQKTIPSRVGGESTTTLLSMGIFLYGNDEARLNLVLDSFLLS